MDRRDFVGVCAASTAAACLTTMPTGFAVAANAQPRSYARALLTDEFGDPIRLQKLRAKTNYIFHYPFEGTPAFLLDLGVATRPTQLSAKDRTEYQWPGGVGPKRSVVAFSAICAHKLVYPNKELSFISFRPGKALNPNTPNAGNDLIHCCADHSQYDPRQGAKVLSGPAEQPLCAILLEHDPRQDTLTAYATLGGELFDEFFQKYAFKLSLDSGPRARERVAQRSVVTELERFCRNPVRC
jgi:arsenite oxidase small subunit